MKTYKDFMIKENKSNPYNKKIEKTLYDIWQTSYESEINQKNMKMPSYTSTASILAWEQGKLAGKSDRKK